VVKPDFGQVGADAIRFILNHASLPAVAVESARLATLLEVYPL
jgi:hypothetical protein